MKKLDDAIRRFGKPERVINTDLFFQGFDQDAICKHLKVPADIVNNDKYQVDATGVDDPKPVFLEGSHMADKIALLKMEIEALQKLLDDRDETIDFMVHSPQEIMGWLSCAALIATVFLAHGLGYL